LEWLRQAQLNPNIILTRDRLTLRQLFSGGVLDYYVADSADYELLAELMGVERVGVSLLPNSPAQMAEAATSGFATPVLGVEALFFNYASRDDRFELAQHVAEFMTNTTQSTIAMRQTTRVPANRLVNISPEIDQPQHAFREQAKTARPLPNDIDHDRLRQIGERVYVNVLTGVSEPAEAMCAFVAELGGDPGQAGCPAAESVVPEGNGGE
jgi:hypothetical protein